MSSQPNIHGDYFNVTNLHPVGVAAIAVLGLATLLLPRRYALVPMLLGACFISAGQRIVLLSLDFSLLRILILAGAARVVLLGETTGFRWRPLDVLVVGWSLSSLAIGTLREGNVGALVYYLGRSFDAVGTYMLVRVLVRSLDDLIAFVRIAALISLPVAAAFVLEHRTGRNLFSVFGGVAEFTEVREGRVRCRGPFAHPIYAGCFWAALTPMLLALAWDKPRWRWLAPASAVAVGLIIFTSASSTPVLAIAAAIAAVALYPFRRLVPILRGGTVVLLFALHMVMQAPVWHLISRIDIVSGSTGWYRYRLIDGFIRHFDLWAVAGTRAYHDIWGPRYFAITNHYILEGVEGGLVALVLFGAAIVVAFRGMRSLLRTTGTSRFRHLMIWGLGSGLFVHCVSFLAVSYFGQVLMLWFLGLAIVGSLAPRRSTRLALRARVVTSDPPAPPEAAAPAPTAPASPRPAGA